MRTVDVGPLLRQAAADGESAYEITGVGYASEGEVKQNGQPAGADAALQLLGRVSVLCNDAELRREEGAWKVEGDPTEGALYPPRRAHRLPSGPCAMRGGDPLFASNSRS